MIHNITYQNSEALGALYMPLCTYSNNSFEV